MAILLLIPFTASADDASILGPQGSLAPATTAATDSSSPQTGSILQPAGASNSPIQSAGAQAGGIIVPQSQTLQQTGPADQIKVLLAGEGEGQQPLQQERNYSWLIAIAGVIAATIIITAPLVWLERRSYISTR
ncbi:MAG TPA: hypothetical protein VF272_04175 [Candidatus Saccharimonadia bacterium]